MTVTFLAGGRVERVETFSAVCDDGRPDAISTNELSGQASWTGDNLRVDFQPSASTFAGRYFGRLLGGAILVDRREIDVIVVTPGQSPGGPQVNVDLTPLTFERVP